METENACALSEKKIHVRKPGWSCSQSVLICLTKMTVVTVLVQKAVCAFKFVLSIASDLMHSVQTTCLQNKVACFFC